MTLTLLRHAIQKPPPGPLKLDLGHPLAQGLFAAYPFNEGGGQVVGDALGNYPLSYSTATTDFSWKENPFGGGLDSANAADGNVFLSKIGTIFSGTSQPLSIAAFAWCRSVPNSAARIIGFGDASNGTLNYMGVHHQGGSTGCWFPNNTAIFGANMISTTPKWFLIVGTWDGTTPRLYDGLLGQTPTLYTSTSANTAPTSADHIELANRRLGTARNWNGQIGPAYIWTRALSADEIHQLSAEPYAMFQTRSLQKWFVPPGISATVRIPRTFLRHAVQKPPPGPLKPDLGHPLAQGLLSAFAISEVGSRVLNDVTGSLNLSATGSTLPTWQASPYGSVVDSPSGGVGTNWQSATLASSVSYSGLTLAAVGMARSAGGNSLGRVLMLEDGAGGNFLQLYLNTGQLNVQNVGGTNVGGPTPTFNKWYLFAGTWTQNQPTPNNNVGTVYLIPLDGSAIQTGTSGNTSGTLPIVKRINLGNSAAGTRTWDGQFAAVYAWTRVLSQTELQQLAAEPYAMFQTQAVRRWFVQAPSSAPPKSFLRHAIQKPPPGPLKLDTGHPLTPAWGLILNEGSGLPQEAISGKVATASSSAPTWFSSTREVGSAGKFIGPSNQYYSVPSPRSLPFSTGVFTFAVRVYPNDVGTRRTILSMGGNANNSPELEYGTASGEISGIFPGTYIFHSTGGILTANTWHDIVWVQSGTAANQTTLYLDGVTQTLSQSNGGATADSGTNAATVGQRGNNTQFFDGQLSYAYVYNRALTQAEVLQLNAEPYTMFLARPVQRWFVMPTPAAAAAVVAPLLVFPKGIRQNIWQPAQDWMAIR